MAKLPWVAHKLGPKETSQDPIMAYKSDRQLELRWVAFWVAECNSSATQLSCTELRNSAELHFELHLSCSELHGNYHGFVSLSCTPRPWTWSSTGTESDLKDDVKKKHNLVYILHRGSHHHRCTCLSEWLPSVPWVSANFELLRFAYCLCCKSQILKVVASESSGLADARPSTLSSGLPSELQASSCWVLESLEVVLLNTHSRSSL